MHIEKTAFEHKLSDIQNDYEGALAKEKNPFEALKKLQVSVQEVCRQDEWFGSKVKTYNDQFRTELRNGFAVLLTQWQEATNRWV